MGQTAADAGSAAAAEAAMPISHMHEDPAKFPPRSNPPTRRSLARPLRKPKKMHNAIGFDRGVIVHSAIYGSDHRLLLHALESLSDRDRYRGIGIVDDSVSDKELERLHAAGVRGARFNFVRFLALDQREAEVRRSMARLRELGWHARLHVHGDGARRIRICCARSRTCRW